MTRGARIAVTIAGLASFVIGASAWFFLVMGAGDACAATNCEGMGTAFFVMLIVFAVFAVAAIWWIGRPENSN